MCVGADDMTSPHFISSDNAVDWHSWRSRFESVLISSVIWHVTRRNSPEDRRIQVNRSESLRACPAFIIVALLIPSRRTQGWRIELSQSTPEKHIGGLEV